jgi:hypothetical protein
MQYVNFSIKRWPMFGGLVCALCAAALLGGCSLWTSPYSGPRSSGGYSTPPPSAPYPAPQTSSPPPSAPVQAAQTAGRPAEPSSSGQASPRAHASLRVTDQGRQLLLGGQVEEAISVLERATGMNPDNGEAYYWLAEAWLKKGNPKQALEYHHQAWLRLRTQPAWNGRLRDQRERMQRAGD